MNGGPSQIDTWDPKPALVKVAGQQPASKLPTQTTGARFLPSPFRFRQCGESGIPVSETLPHLAGVVDDLCIVRSMTTDTPSHEPAILQMHTGHVQPTRPSFGSWILYGLGTENDNLPGYVVLRPRSGIVVGPALWSSGFLPAKFQGTSLNTRHMQVEKLIANIRNPKWTTAEQRRQIDLLRALNHEHSQQRAGDTRLDAEIAAMETAFRMQHEAMEKLDIAGEPRHVREMYGDSHFGQATLLARRLVEAGVRVVTVYNTREGRQPWDTHQEHNRQHLELCPPVDRAAAALIRDLKSRGLLDETLVIWGGEFGRTPYGEYREDPNKVGRDHHPHGFSMVLAGGGIRGGTIFGATDELGMRVVSNPVHVHDLHATILHLLGIDHERLTFHFGGREFRLTDVYGNVVHDILAT